MAIATPESTAAPRDGSASSIELRAQSLELEERIASDRENLKLAQANVAIADERHRPLHVRVRRGEKDLAKDDERAERDLESARRAQTDAQLALEQDLADLLPRLEELAAAIAAAERDEAIAELERDAATLRPQLQAAVDGVRSGLALAGNSYRRGRELQGEWRAVGDRASALGVAIGFVGANWTFIERAVRSDVRDAEVVCDASDRSDVVLRIGRDGVWEGGGGR